MGLISHLFNLIFTYPIFNALMVLYHLLGDFGLAIIVLTIAISLLLLPLTRRQLKSMKIIRSLQPEVAEINKRYAQDLKARKEAMTALYKHYGVSQSASYLPLLIQAPLFGGIFFALTTVLNHATLGDLNGIIYPFLPHLTSLPNIDLNWFTIFNSTWHISLALPDPNHVLPILTGIVTFIQMRIAQPQTMAQVKDTVAQFNHIIQFIMPLIMVLITILIAWQLAAGLALYRTTSLLFNMLQQYLVNGIGSLLSIPNFAGFSNSTRTAMQARLETPSTKVNTREKGTSAHRGRKSRRNRRRK